MHSSQNRRTAPKVVDGKVQRKNRQALTSCKTTIIDRESPRHGFKHVVSKQDLFTFIDLISDWDRLSERLERIVLAAPSTADARHIFYHGDRTAAIELYAWDQDLWVELNRSYFDSHRHIFDRLGVSYDIKDDEAICRFTDSQARAFMLLHVFMHELGHHYDRLNQKHRLSIRGEDYAERFANNRFDQFFMEYVKVFGDLSKKA